MKKGYYVLMLVAMLICTSILSANAVQKSANSRPAFAPNEVVVKLRPEAAAKALIPKGLYAASDRFGINELDQILSLRGGTQILRAHRAVKDKAWAKSVGWDDWYIVKLDGRSSVESAISSLKQNRYIEEAIPHYLFYPTAIPNDPLNGPNWGHYNTGNNGPGSGTAGFDSKARQAWDLPQGYGDPDIIIAIIDTGVDTNHEDLRLVAGWDYGDNDNNPMDDSDDPGHGTACAGISAAIANNGKGVSGIAGACSVMPLKVANSTGQLLFTAIDNAIMYAVNNGAHIISMSLGTKEEQEISQGDIPSTDNALNYAYNQGLVIFAATGNANAANICYPANHEKVLAVGAASPSGQRKSPTSSDGQYWWGSNYGVNTQDHQKAVDIMGPTILPTTKVGSGSGGGGFGVPSNSYRDDFNGTSCATPYVAGVAALLLSRDSSLSPAEVRSALTQNTTDMTYDGGVGWDRYTGYGMVNAYQALLSLGTPPPINLYATPEAGKITLYWEAPNPSITHYNIYRDGNFLDNTIATTFSDENVIDEKYYYYEVSAVDIEGESPKVGIEVQAGPIQEAILGTGSNNSGTISGSPINVYYKSLHGQSVYTKTELNAAGIFGPIRLSELGFEVAEAPAYPLPNFIVRLKHSTANNVANWQTVGTEDIYYTNASYMPTVGWDILKLNAEFIWNGEDNIVVDTAFNLIQSYSSSGQVKVSSMNNGYRFARSDYSNQSNVFTGNDVLNTRPNLKMVFRPIYIEPDPELSISLSEIDFGEIYVGGNSRKSFEISNSGGGTLEILPADINIDGTDATDFDFVWPEGGISLEANENMMLNVEFSPLSAGDKSATLNILNQSITLSGSATVFVIDSFPYTENFDAVTVPALPAGWSVLNANNDDRTWFVRDQFARSQPNCLAIQTNINTDDYAFTPAMELEAGQNYKLEFAYRAGSSRYPDRLKVYLANAPTEAGIQELLLDFPELNNATYDDAATTFSPSASGSYYIAWYCDSVPPSNYVMIDNVKIDIIYDFPEDEMVSVDTGAESINITVGGGNANSAEGSLIPPVNNSHYNEIYSFVLELLGGGPWDIEIETMAAFGAYYQGGWHEETNDAGFIRFTGIQSAKSGLNLPITLGGNSPTLPVELSSFNAFYSAIGNVRIAWVAESETNHAGYHILRNESGKLDSALQINSDIITAGTQNGSQMSYLYIDAEIYENMNYHYWLCSVSQSGMVDYHGPITVKTSSTHGGELPPIPVETKLHTAFPNPFNPSVNLRYSMKEAGDVALTIYNLKGQLVRSYQRHHTEPGYYQFFWDGRDDRGAQQSTGVYFYRMQSGSYNAIKKMIMAK